MKKFFILCLMALVMCSCNLEQKRLEQERARFVADSLAKRELFVADSIAKAKEFEDSLRLVNFKTQNKHYFSYKKDEFSNIVWVEPKNATNYRNTNAIYCYFALVDNKPQNFRFVFQYYAEDWLFIKNMVFNIDGENYCIAPKMERDHNHNIWEWCDCKVYKTCPSDEIKYTKENADMKAEAVVNEKINEITYSKNGVTYTEINEFFIKKLAYAKSVKIKLNGSQYYDTRTLSTNQILYIRKIYEYFIMGKGSF